jgi:hypothetical protein
MTQLAGEIPPMAPPPVADDRVRTVLLEAAPGLATIETPRSGAEVLEEQVEPLLRVEPRSLYVVAAWVDRARRRGAMITGSVAGAHAGG